MVDGAALPPICRGGLNQIKRHKVSFEMWPDWEEEGTSHFNRTPEMPVQPHPLYRWLL